MIRIPDGIFILGAIVTVVIVVLVMLLDWFSKD
jgi:hypothetical protein